MSDTVTHVLLGTETTMREDQLEDPPEEPEDPEDPPAD